MEQGEFQERRDLISPEGGGPEGTLHPTIITGLWLRQSLRGDRLIGLPGWATRCCVLISRGGKAPAFPFPGVWTVVTSADSPMSWEDLETSQGNLGKLQEALQLNPLMDQVGI